MFNISVFSILSNVHREFLKVQKFFRFISNDCKESLYPRQKKWKIIFYGTDNFSTATLAVLNKNMTEPNCCKVVESLDVICVNSHCAVRDYASSHHLTIHTWPYDLPRDKYDIGVVASFGHMIPEESIKSCKFGMINAHPSLLPRWRGSSPIFYSILKGDNETGVTITQVSPNKFDVGNIIMQNKYKIPENCTTQKLAEDLRIMSAHMVLKTLENLQCYLESSYLQSKEGTTHALKIKNRDLEIHWERERYEDIDRKFRAFKGYFELYTFMKDMKVSILDLIDKDSVLKANIDSLASFQSKPGYCYFHKRRKALFIKCKDGWHGVTSLKTTKSGMLSALDFHNGYLSKMNPTDHYFHSQNISVLK